MKKFLKIGAIALVITLISTGCRTSPILNVPNQAIVAPNNKVTTDDIYKAIARAGASLGWNMQKKSDGVILATLNLRDHQAVVIIKYTKGASDSWLLPSNTSTPGHEETSLPKSDIPYV